MKHAGIMTFLVGLACFSAMVSAHAETPLSYQNNVSKSERHVPTLTMGVESPTTIQVVCANHGKLSVVQGQHHSAVLICNPGF